MKKTFNTPEIVELDFKETSAICGIKGKGVISISGGLRLTTSEECFNISGYMNGRFGANFLEDDEISEDYDEE